MNNSKSEETENIIHIYIFPFANGKKEICNTMITYSTPFSAYPYDVSYHENICNVLVFIYAYWTHKYCNENELNQNIR
jgi:hypothetical protein